MERLEPIDYEAPQSTRSSGAWLFGLIACLCCMVQIPWGICAGWAFWSVLWGDNQPPLGGLVMTFLAAAIPCLLAISLGLFALMRKSGPRFDRVAGAIGFFGGIIWAVFFVLAFLDQLKSRF